ncbi:MAG: hypothetical protein KC591_06745 [Gemmatimonadetes bacterium]|nr:hypothetical protein [Gemmatimonadota bacterium]
MSQPIRLLSILLPVAALAVSGTAHAAESMPTPLANLSLFAGLDGSKQPQDLGINANMGGRFAVDTGFALWKSGGLGLHVGAGANFSDAAVHVLDQIEGTSRRTQYYGSVGLFQTAGSLRWAAGYDYQHNSYYDDFRLAQFRGRIGYAVTPHNELGVWGTASLRDDVGTMGDTEVTLQPIQQVNAFLRHTWPSRAWTSVWGGYAAGHDNVVWVLPPDTRDKNVFVYGADLFMPLSDRFAMTGAANFLTPTATGTVDAHLGLTFYPGGGVFGPDARPFAPVQTTANNATFSVDLTR